MEGEKERRGTELWDCSRLTNREVDAAVDAQLRVQRVALHQPLEGPNILGLAQQGEDAAGVCEAVVGVLGKTALQAARVVLVGVGGVVGAAVDGRQAAGAKVDSVVDKGPRGDAAATRASRQVHGGVALVLVNNDVVGICVIHRDAVAAHGRLAAVEDGRVGQAFLGGARPVPVREGACVAALVAEGLFMFPDEPTMPA